MIGCFETPIRSDETPKRLYCSEHQPRIPPFESQTQGQLLKPIDTGKYLQNVGQMQEARKNDEIDDQLTLAMYDASPLTMLAAKAH
ncbi:unnamed protein product [Didymodactylos carnosus]|uniref:Uncharacterized protein n=1 Tax=Didymodactylos carnosus TaxID=1234261 RepID=A0A814UT86_9BILA|nr:unnamed protein product [Didymodactylos carnosus]CAF1178856.1 unnamed protein product [Didymodactylos carnosus]CAF3820563.1 unnamed protein product [Didymodactylos carnosus]CAF3943067.1 unnamed protein product [Didymodactylos carnosus]